MGVTTTKQSEYVDYLIAEKDQSNIFELMKICSFWRLTAKTMAMLILMGSQYIISRQ